MLRTTEGFTGRVTYIAECSPLARRARGLIKVGQSKNPERRVRKFGMRVLGTTGIPELVVRTIFAHFAVPPHEIDERGLECAGEWFYDDPLIRKFVPLLCALHPAPPPGQGRKPISGPESAVTTP